MEAPSCPDRETWQRFARGGVDETLLDGMADHLGDCRDCRDVLAGLEGAGCDLVDEFRGTTTTTLGRFRILESLGAGGLGAVYRAFDPDRGRDVALKLLLPHAALDARWRRRFLNEGALTRLDHPHVIRVFEAGRAEGTDYLAMEYCAGPSLARWIESADGPVPVRLAARIVAEVAEGAAFCHEQGVVHRDISPSNILLFPREPSPDEEHAFGYIVKLADFGLARGLPRVGARDGSDTPTPTGAILGKLEYLAPEVLREGSRGADPRADVFALGVLLYHLLAGRSPFRGINAAQTLRNVELHEPPSPRSRRPDVGRDLETICLKCLEKEPGRRYGSARAAADDLRRFLDGEAILARPASPAERTWRWCRHRPAVAALAAALGLALCGGFLGMFLLWRHAEAERRRAETDFRTTDEVLSQIVEQTVGGARLQVVNPDSLIASLQQTRARLLAVAAGRPDHPAVSRHLASVDQALGTTLTPERRLDEARFHFDESLRYFQAVLRHDPLDHVVRGKLIGTFLGLAQIAKSPEETLSHVRRAVDAGEELVRLRPDANSIVLLADCRNRLAGFLARRGDHEKAGSFVAANRRMLENVPAEAECPAVAAWRVFVHLDFDRFRTGPAPTGTAAPRKDGSGLAEPLARLAGPDADGLSAEDWAELAARSLRPPSHPVLGPAQESLACYELAVRLSVMAAEQRHCGRLDEARRTAERMLALGRHLVARHPRQPAAHLALSEAYIAINKNAWQIEDWAAIERNLRLSLDAALQAQVLDPDNETVRFVVDSRQRRLKDLLQPE